MVVGTRDHERRERLRTPRIGRHRGVGGAGSFTGGFNALAQLAYAGVTVSANVVDLQTSRTLVSIDDLSGAERFFLSWAQAWQQKGRDEEVIRLIAIDPHSPNEFRCNQIVRNIDGFYDTFDVVESDALWLAPTERVTIW